MSVISPAAFRQRFAVAGFPDGGVLVDTISGSYFRLNASASAVCQILQTAATIEGATKQVAQQLNLAHASAAEQICSIVEALAPTSPSKPSSEPTAYQESPDGGYDLCIEGAPVFHIDAQGRHLSLVSPPRSSALRMSDLLRNLGARLAFLRGLVVLHGSAVFDRDGAAALCGVSEAGKTTTARLLAKYGRELLAEDLVVASIIGDSQLHLFRDGERHINAWAAATARSFESGEATAASIEPLMDVQHGATVNLHSIWFMDAGRRTAGDSIVNRSLSPPEALLRVLSNSFVGDANWRRFLDVSRRVVAATRAYETSVPNTLRGLEDAIANQRVNSAS